jgi:hypothetical protein
MKHSVDILKEIKNEGMVVRAPFHLPIDLMIQRIKMVVAIFKLRSTAISS